MLYREGLIVSVGCFIISIMCESNNKGLNILAFVNSVIIVSQVKSFSLTVLIEPIKEEIMGIKESKSVFWCINYDRIKTCLYKNERRLFLGKYL